MAHVGPAPEAVPAQPTLHGQADRRDANGGPGGQGVPGTIQTVEAADDDGPLTIGVAIAVPEPHATMLQEVRIRHGDLQALTIPTHVTILPPTPIASDDLERVYDHLAAAAAATVPFRIELLGTDSFRPVSPVVFVPLVRGAGACAALASRVRSGPLARDLDFSYHPHVTIGHNIPDAQLDGAEREGRGVHIDFIATEVVLYLRDGREVWSRVAGFAFTAELLDEVLGLGDESARS